MDRAPLPIAPAALAAGRIAVAGHVLDLSCGDLFTADGTPAALRHKALELLLVLGEHAGQVIGKDELMRRVWPRVVVTEDSLTQAVAAIRRVLGDARHEWLRTRPRRGYMLVSGGEAAAAPRMPAPRSRTLLLPAPDSSLIGRDDDLAALCARVAEGRLVTLAGAGGIGKTRLALAAAHALAGRFDDGVAWVDLAPLHDAARVPAAIATAAGVELAGPDASRALMAALAGRRMLLVLDNCEHLAGAAAEVAGRLRAGAPALHLLTTSQVPLKLGGEQVVRLGPLALPPADASLDAARAFGAFALLEQRARG